MSPLFKRDTHKPRIRVRTGQGRRAHPTRLGLLLVLARVGGLLTLALLVNCSALLDVDRNQCAIDDDCTDLGLGGVCSDGVCIADARSLDPAVDPDACDGPCTGFVDPVCFEGQCASLSQVEPFICGNPQIASGDTVVFEMEIAEYTRPNLELPGLTIQACLLTDVLCEEPISEATRVGTARDFEIALPRGFDGYLLIDSEVTMRFVWQFTSPLDAPVPKRRAIILAYQTIKTIETVANIQVDPTKGVIAMQAYSCDETPQAGIHFEEPSGMATPFYIVNLLPNLDATMTDYTANGDFAVGGFFNAPPGFSVLEARVGVDGPVIATQNANVLPGAMTYLDIRR